MSDLEQQVTDGFKALKEQQAEEFERLKKSVSEEVAAKLEPTEKWLSKVEAQINTARSHGPGRDGLLAAIPAEYRKHVDVAERHGYADPVDVTAKSLWWHYQFMMAMGMRSRMPRSSGDYQKMSDDLERGWGFDPVLKAALGEAAGSGANIIATPVEAELLRLIRDNTIVRPLATKIVMSSLTHQIPVENSNVTAYIVPEVTVITDSMPATTFAQRPLTAKAFAGLATVSNQLLQDNIIGLNQYLFASIAEHIGILEDQGALDGGTTAASVMVQNFSGVAVAPGVGSFTVTATSAAGGNIPTYAELIKLVYSAQQNATRAGAGFFMTPLAFKNIVSLVDTTGQPIFSFANVPGAIPNFVGGYPVHLVSSLSTVWGNVSGSSTNIYFGPPAKIIYGDISGMSFDLDPYSLLDKVQTRIRVLKRTGILVPVGQYFTFARGVLAS